MNSQAFNPGDVVVLKSGGPKMTVEEVGEYLLGIGAKCIWFDGKTRKEEVFALQTIARYDPTSGPL